jgi:hypothetical protein
MIKYLFIVFGIIFCAFKCFIQKDNNQRYSDLQGISVFYSIPIVNWNASITNKELSYNVYYYKDLIMYENTYKFDSTESGVAILNEDRKRYFLFHKDSLFGRLYYPDDPHSLPTGRRSIYDTLYPYRLEGLTYDSFASVKPDSLYKDVNGNLVKVFLGKDTTAASEKYSMKFYYCKELVNIKESLSRKMDNVDGQKLFRIITHMNGDYYDMVKMTFPPRTLVLEMKKLIPANPDVIRYFHDYERGH